MSGQLRLLILAAILQPAAGGLCIAADRFSRKLSSLLATASSLILLAVCARLFFGFVEPLEEELFFSDFYVDKLSLLISFVASFIGFLCILYSYSYMASERGAGRYYFWMLTFISSMVFLASANSLLVLVAAWELTGLCSYSLISFWNYKKEAVSGAYKAVLITELGSSLLLAGFAILSHLTEAHTVQGLLSSHPESPLSLLACIFILVAIVSKSAQFPLHVWLPDAMAAPTPVSALLHAAAMVKAGIYLLARFWPLFATISGTWSVVFVSIGAVTMLVGGLYMLVQSDLKRLLAYSTISQLGYMVTSIGLGTALGYAAAIFHLLNHAVIKGLLFLSAGSIEHETKTRIMDEMGGLAGKMPITAAGFLLGSLSLAGVPPLNGFVSKWMIYEAGLSVGGVLGVVATVSALAASVLTLAALLKAAHSIFFGLRSEKYEHVRESPFSMTFPLIVLSGVVITVGVYPYPALRYFIPGGEGLIQSRFTIVTNAGYLSESIVALLIALGLALGLVLFLLFRGLSAPSPGLRGDVFICGEDLAFFAPEELHFSAVSFYTDTLCSRIRSLYAWLNVDSIYTLLSSRAYQSLSRLSKDWWPLVGVLLVVLLLLLSLGSIILGW